MTTHIKAIIFDLDGTLLNTIDDLADSMNRVLRQKGFPTRGINSYCQFVGAGSLDLTKRSLPQPESSQESLVTECHQLFLDDYASNWNNQTTPYPGIPEMLSSLQDNKIKSAILSNKPHAATLRCVRELLSQWHFEITMGQQPVIPKKPDATAALDIMSQLSVTPDQCLMVGDTAIDIETAKNALIKSVGVLWGFRPREELEGARADYIIETPDELIQLIQ